MQINKINLELAIPVIEQGDSAEAICLMVDQQTDFLAGMWREILSQYKVQGVPVKSLIVKAGKPTAKKVAPDRTTVKDLLDYHLKREPKAQVAPQIMAIKRLIETGKTKEELIALYEESLKEYKLTTWLTVRHKLGKAPAEEVEPKTDFTPVVLDADKKAELKERLKSY